MQENRPVSRGQAVVVRVSVTLDEMLRKPCLFTLTSRSSGLVGLVRLTVEALHDTASPITLG
jgi:hypothetical protein